MNVEKIGIGEYEGRLVTWENSFVLYAYKNGERIGLARFVKTGENSCHLRTAKVREDERLVDKQGPNRIGSGQKKTGKSVMLLLLAHGKKLAEERGWTKITYGTGVKAEHGFGSRKSEIKMNPAHRKHHI